MQHVEKMGLMSPYNVSSSSIWVPLTVPMADVFKDVPESELVEFLRALKSESGRGEPREVARHTSYIDYCIRGITEKVHRTKSHLTFSAKGTPNVEEDFVYLLIPMGDFTWKASKTNDKPTQPTQSAQPPRPKGG